MSPRRTTESSTTGGYTTSRQLPLAQYELRCSLHAPLPIGRVFRLFEDPRNLAKITPSWLRFEIRTSGEIEMKPGTKIDYTIHWLGLPMGWTSVITEYDPPRLFIDQQVRGPYAYWRHRHDFFSDAQGTVITDLVQYSLPLGPLGRLAQSILVKRQLLGIFRFRQLAIPKLLGVGCKTIEEPSVHTLQAG
jgi:ligand-binding SRPBCC domain-containing protein